MTLNTNLTSYIFADTIMRYSGHFKKEALHKCCYICYRILFGDYLLIYLTKPPAIGHSTIIHEKYLITKRKTLRKETASLSNETANYSNLLCRMISVYKTLKVF